MTGNSEEQKERHFDPVSSLFAAIALVCLFALFSIPFKVCQAADSIGKITAVNGVVQLKRPGVEKEYSPVKGDSFLVGDDIRTGKDSTVQLSFTDESFVNLFENSSVRVNQYAFDPEKNRRTARIRLLGGKARFVLFKPRSNDSFVWVDTNNASVNANTIADFGILSTSRETEVATLAHGVIVKNFSQLIVGDVWVDANMRTVVVEKNPPSLPEILTPQERRNYMQDTRAQRHKKQ
jgi:hypothetical protein